VSTADEAWVVDVERHFTERQYQAWVDSKGRQMAEKATAALPEWMREAGLRFEWARPADEPTGAFTDAGPGYDLDVVSDVLRHAHIARARQRRERDRMLGL
jgi:hypothetical protein